MSGANAAATEVGVTGAAVAEAEADTLMEVEAVAAVSLVVGEVFRTAVAGEVFLAAGDPAVGFHAEEVLVVASHEADRLAGVPSAEVPSAKVFPVVVHSAGGSPPVDLHEAVLRDDHPVMEFVADRVGVDCLMVKAGLWAAAVA